MGRLNISGPRPIQNYWSYVKKMALMETSDTTLIRMRSKIALHSMENKIDELPLLPQVLVRILQLDPKSDEYFDEFELTAKEDPAFAVRIIALANSAASSPVEPIAVIRDALARMGATTVGSFVASLAVQRVFMPTEPNQILLWKHSISTAVGAQCVAKLIPELQVEPAHAYLVGLLHDVGRFVMFEHAPKQLLEVDEHNWQIPDDLDGVNVEVFNFTHSELGYLACVHWGVPEQIADVIRHHHTPISGRVIPHSPDATTFCVQIADRLSVTVIDSADSDEISDDEQKSRIAGHCLTRKEERRLLPVDRLLAIVDSIKAESRQLMEDLGLQM